LPEPLLKTDYAKKVILPEKMSLAKKPEPNFPKLLLKKCSRFQKPDFAKRNASQKKWTLCLDRLDNHKMKPLASQNFN
jgi:hypothetical protein